MEQLFGSITAVMGGIDADKAVDEAVAFAAWNMYAGEMLRDRTVPVAYHDKRLVIAVQDNTWKRHLEDLSPQVLVKLNAKLGHGSVKFVEFRIEPERLDEARQARLKELASVPEPPEAAPSLQKAAMAITDERLREKFLAAAATYLERQSLGKER